MIFTFEYNQFTIAMEVVSARRPDKAVASPYEGIRKGRAVIMNMPNPKPVVRCTKLAPAASRNMYRIVTGTPEDYFLFSATTFSTWWV